MYSINTLPLISIITPSFNQREFLENTIRSVLDQDYSNIEYIIIDGGSTDGSLNILRTYEDQLAYWVSENDNGQAHAINKGLLKSRGEIVGWLNADDVLMPSTVSHAVEIFQKNPDVDVIYGRLERIDEHNNGVPTPLLPKDTIDFGLGAIIGECVVNQPGSFWRRSIMEKVGLLDQNLKYALDYEYWIRIALAGGKFIRTPEIVARFRLNQRSKTISQTSEMGLEQLEILEKTLMLKDLHYKIGMTNEQIQKRAQKTRAAIHLHISYGYLKKHKLDSFSYWFVKALQTNPFILFERRWMNLAIASLYRRIKAR